MKYILLAVALFINIQANEAKGAQPPASLVKTVKVKEGYANSLQNYVGTLYYDVNSELASESSGVVSKLYVKEGQRVNKGNILLKLESSILEAKLKAKQAILNSFLARQTKQEKDLKRAEALISKKSIAQSSYDNTFYTLESLNAEIQSQKAELLSMQIELQKKSIRAPFNGVVVKRNVDIGEWVSVGSSVFNLVDPKSIEARVNVPSKLLQTLSKGQKLQSTIEKKDMQVVVKTIVPLADKASRTFPVKLSFESQKHLIEGMRIDVKVPTLKKEKVLLVPRDAVIKRFGSFVVFSVVDGKAMMIPVSVISYSQSEAAISAQGLKLGMRVVTKGNERIFPNMPVVEKAN
ncbi:efflux RND transporter periplasmic adaptor subunit [Sulfurimonas sp.]|uniref:efflux RND transporter periplasmic adaptor subunit n=1 Tax=Sulfurimonas sp. TaxID=2022749 RepID=UPI0025EBE366|nr:efflux RND transporter periplasmic adaptor subunit [Sulfurimonas sp.]